MRTVCNKKEKEKRLDDSFQCIKTPVGNDADSVQGYKGSTFLWRQQDVKWEKGNVQEQVWLDRGVGGGKTKNALFATLARSTSEVGSVRVRNMWVLGCVPGNVNKRGGKQVSNSCSFLSFLHSNE